jgi:hypothetical protein
MSSSETKKSLCPARDGNQKFLSKGLNEHVGLTFCKVDYASYDVPSETLQAKHPGALCTNVFGRLQVIPCAQFETV